MGVINEHNRSFYLNLYKDIVLVNGEYYLQNPYEGDEGGNIRKTSEHDASQNKNAFFKDCNR